MKIEFENIVLRDMSESDIEDYVRWFTTQTEWSKTDAPWEPIESDEEAERASWQEYYESVKDLPDDVRRWKFEIEWNGMADTLAGSALIPSMNITNGSVRSRMVKPSIVPLVLISAKAMSGVMVLAPMHCEHSSITTLEMVWTSFTHRLGRVTSVCSAVLKNWVLRNATGMWEVDK